MATRGPPGATWTTLVHYYDNNIGSKFVDNVPVFTSREPPENCQIPDSVDE